MLECAGCGLQDWARGWCGCGISHLLNIYQLRWALELACWHRAILGSWGIPFGALASYFYSMQFFLLGRWVVVSWIGQLRMLAALPVASNQLWAFQPRESSLAQAALDYHLNLLFHSLGFPSHHVQLYSIQGPTFDVRTLDSFKCDSRTLSSHLPQACPCQSFSTA